MPTSTSITLIRAVSSLADFSSEELMIPQLREREMPGVISELSRVLQQHSRIPDMLPYYHAALNREFLMSTAMEHGIAFPHARMGGVPRLCFALGRCPDPISWGKNHGAEIRLVFLTAVPATNSTGYIHLISGLARLAKNRETLSGLHEAASAAKMFALLRGVQLRFNEPPEKV
jgi:mannitol/fructose-specific phosphotransferase system IIA component (Ntr-type)